MPDVDTCVQLPSGFSNQFFDFFLFFSVFFVWTTIVHNFWRKLRRNLRLSDARCMTSPGALQCFRGSSASLAVWHRMPREAQKRQRIVSDTKKAGQKNMQKETDTPS